jgi:hypothetical protein
MTHPTLYTIADAVHASGLSRSTLLDVADRLKLGFYTLGPKPTRLFRPSEVAKIKANARGVVGRPIGRKNSA